MLLVDPFPAASAPVSDGLNVIDHLTREKRRQPRQALDTQLLCSKLETFKREQEAARVRREKRNALRNRSYVPRSAAQTFAATIAAPTKDDTNISMRSRKHLSAPTTLVSESLNADTQICLPSKQLYATLNFGFDDVESEPKERPSVKVHGRTLTKSERAHAESFILDCTNSMSLAEEKYMSRKVENKEACEVDQAVQAAEKIVNGALPEPFETIERTKTPEEKRDLMDPSSRDGKRVPLLPGSSPSDEKRASSQRSPRTRTAKAEKEACFSSPDLRSGPYRPGDAEKRRSVIGSARSTTEAIERTASFHTIPEVNHNRVSRFLESEVSLRDPILEFEDFQSPKERTKLVPNDRPDWSQKSKNKIEIRHALHFFRKADKEECSERERKRSSVLDCRFLAPFVESKSNPPTGSRGPQNDHMIADAVRIIKQGERLRLRKSLIGFIKKL